MKSYGMSKYEQLGKKLGIRKHPYMTLEPEKVDKFLPWVNTIILNLNMSLLVFRLFARSNGFGTLVR